MPSKLLQYHILSNRHYDNEKELDSIENLCKGFKGKNVLEIGCGIGRLAQLIKEKGGIYIGIDQNKEFIKYCKRKYKELNFLEAQANKLPFENEQFDVILYPWILPDIKDVLSVIKEGYRVLKRSGLVIIIDGTFQGDYGRLIKKFFKNTDSHRELYFGKLRKSLSSAFKKIAIFKQAKVPYIFPSLKIALKAITMELKYLEKLKLSKADIGEIKEKLKKLKDQNIIINETVAFHKCQKL